MIKVPRPRGASGYVYYWLFRALLQKDQTPKEIIAFTGFDRKTVFHQLKSLRERGLIEFRKEGKNKIYHAIRFDLPYNGWMMPWFSLMNTKTMREHSLKKMIINDEYIQFKEKYDDDLTEFVIKYLISQNQELIDILQKNNLLNIPIKILCDLIDGRYCMHCLITKKQWNKTRIKNEELICNVCALVIEENYQLSEMSLYDRLKSKWMAHEFGLIE